ncbi:MAG: M20 family metallopeptidase [Desulfovibrionales bacterium]|nr:M20 family metallopeptidase [Desulfovibrionales bacterium]
MIESVRKFMQAHEDDMVALLKKLVEINSYSHNKAGSNAVADVIQEECEALGLHTRRDVHELVGDTLIVETTAHRNGQKGILLCGHMDTVFVPDSGFTAFRRDAGKFYGPGVADMKCGLVEGVFLFKALRHLNLLDTMSIVLVCNADEEIGSPYSTDRIIAEAKKSCVAFVLESAKESGELVVGRKGRMTFELEVCGQAGHAATAPKNKPSAILELACQIQAYEALNAPEEGTSVNVGVIEGGTGVNTVAERARAVVECRYTNKECGEKVYKTIQKLVASPQTEGTTCTVNIIGARPSMTTSDAILGLFDLVQEAGKELGLSLTCVQCGGGSDANTISQLGIPVIDGVGPIGGNLHSEQEYLLAETFVERAALTTVVVARAWDRYCQQ